MILDLFILFLFHLLFNQVGQLKTSSLLQLRPGQDKAKQCDKNNTDLHINNRTVNNTIEKKNRRIYVQCVQM